jgi:hypothetical protein
MLNIAHDPFGLLDSYSNPRDLLSMYSVVQQMAERSQGLPAAMNVISAHVDEVTG